MKTIQLYFTVIFNHLTLYILLLKPIQYSIKKHKRYFIGFGDCSVAKVATELPRLGKDDGSSSIDLYEFFCVSDLYIIDQHQVIEFQSY